MKKVLYIFVLSTFFLNCITGYQPLAQAEEFRLPAPGVMVHLSPQYTPAILKGITIHPEDPFKFDFIIYRGEKALTGNEKKDEYKKLVKYFLASLAIPDEDQWVNLSPYEKDRIIKDDFGKTLMGRDLLAQDYILKQITASLIYPEDNLGKKFWDSVYLKALAQFGTTNIPVNTFNKVWIIPDDAFIYEKGNTAYVLKNHLKVMLEEDYLSLSKHQGIIARSEKSQGVNKIGRQVVRELVLPALEKEVNEGKNFALLRQVYSGMLLAAWFKRTLRHSLLDQVYADRSRIKGIDQDPKSNEAIYQRYLQAYKKGVFNYIKEDVDKYSNEAIPRKYFSGGEVGYSDRAALAELGHVSIKSTNDAAVLTEYNVGGQLQKVDLAAVSMNNIMNRRDLLGFGLKGGAALTLINTAGILGSVFGLFTEPSMGQDIQGRIFQDFSEGRQENLILTGASSDVTPDSGPGKVIKIIQDYQEALTRRNFIAILQEQTKDKLVSAMGIDRQLVAKMSFESFVVRVVARYLSKFNIAMEPALHPNGDGTAVLLCFFFKIKGIQNVKVPGKEIWSKADEIKSTWVELGDQVIFNGHKVNSFPGEISAQSIYGNVFYFPSALLGYLQGFQTLQREEKQQVNRDTDDFLNSIQGDLSRYGRLGGISDDEKKRELLALNFAAIQGRNFFSTMDPQKLIKMFIHSLVLHELRHHLDRKVRWQSTNTVVDLEIDAYLAQMRTGYLAWISMLYFIGNNWLLGKNPNDPDLKGCLYILNKVVRYIQNHFLEFPMIQRVLNGKPYEIMAQLHLIKDTKLLQHLADVIYQEHQKEYGHNDHAMAADAAMVIYKHLRVWVPGEGHGTVESFDDKNSEASIKFRADQKPISISYSDIYPADATSSEDPAMAAKSKTLSFNKENDYKTILPAGMYLTFSNLPKFEIVTWKEGNQTVAVVMEKGNKIFDSRGTGHNYENNYFSIARSRDGNLWIGLTDIFEYQYGDFKIISKVEPSLIAKIHGTAMGLYIDKRVSVPAGNGVIERFEGEKVLVRLNKGGTSLVPYDDIGDEAQVALTNTTNSLMEKGGIDLNSANLNLLIKRDGKGMPLPVAQQDLAQFRDIEGLDPVILSIEPASQTALLAEFQK